MSEKLKAVIVILATNYVMAHAVNKLTGNFFSPSVMLVIIVLTSAVSYGIFTSIDKK